MFPFFVLDLPFDVTDKKVRDRYYQLIKKFSPDRYPEQFTAINSAYEALKTEESRLQTQLFYNSFHDLFTPEILPDADSKKIERKRFLSHELSKILRETDDE